MVRSIALISLLGFAVTISFAQAPSTLSVQGLLTDPGGDVVPDGKYDVVFSLYDTLSGGTSLWDEAHNGAIPVFVKNGVFDVLLGLKADLSTFKFDKPLYLGMTVDSDPEIVPRSALTAAAYAKALPGMYTFYHDAGSHSGHNVAGGDPGNVMDAGIAGATIGGGGGWISTEFFPNRVGGHFATVGGGRENTAEALQSTVGGGAENTASGTTATVGGGKTNIAGGGEATIGGGAMNTANGWRATIGGGASNTATGDFSAIGGGFENSAIGNFSFAAGYRAAANHEGAFVWNDRSGSDSLLSTNTNQFIVGATNGIGFNTPPENNGIHLKQQGHLPQHGIRLEFSTTSDYWDTYIGQEAPTGFYTFSFNGLNRGYIQATDGAYVSLSDARLKEDFQSYHDVLSDVAQLHPSTYRFKSAPASSPRSLGFTAQDVERFFPELVSENDGIKGLNYGGLSVVALKAIQELFELTTEQGKQLAAQQAEIERMRRVMERE